MRSRSMALRVAVVAGLALQSAGVFGIGALFPRQGSGANLYTPGARAFIHRSGLREDLILQIGFAGKPAEFAWVIPIPSRPVAQFANASIFEELRRVFNPRLIPGPGTRVPAEPGKGEQGPPPVQIQDSTIISPYEAGALPRWLRSNGYEVPDAAYGVIQDYVKHQWFFVVARVRASPAENPRWLQPVWITFQSQRAVLPIKLASLGAKPIVAQLFVAADVFVRAPGFVEAYRSDSPARTSYKQNELPLFFQVVTRDCKLTELRRRLDPKDISADIAIVPK